MPDLYFVRRISRSYLLPECNSEHKRELYVRARTEWCVHNKLKLKMSNKYSYAIYFGVFTKEIISLGKKIILYYPKMIEYSICFFLFFFFFSFCGRILWPFILFKYYAVIEKVHNICSYIYMCHSLELQFNVCLTYPLL